MIHVHIISCSFNYFFKFQIYKYQNIVSALQKTTQTTHVHVNNQSQNKVHEKPTIKPTTSLASTYTPN